MKSFILLSMSAALLITASCNNSGSTDSVKEAKSENNAMIDSQNAPQAMPPAPMTDSLTKSDANFVVNAADAGMLEVELGNVAQTNGMNQAVKDFGSMMVTDHTAVGEKLKKLAAAKNLAVPETLSDKSQDKKNKMQEKKGKDFDKAYAKAMVDGHKDVISSFEEEAKSGTDADIKAFAADQLPTLHHHLDEAQKMLNKVK
ncbi:DUF4142 domain-containing protein [Taibaiella soli]|uniref:DUF4142 domain-containing protein n=1 Tax=Taibaiella soli TaxID=1649169 RepID=A0A2W2AH62_9BACT|nr:DUF4142 domain-containing protein [Taibaiella soli]PZF74611.1 DUF4142 domain-containing protein [Taibaiella soli]